MKLTKDIKAYQKSYRRQPGNRARHRARVAKLRQDPNWRIAAKLRRIANQEAKEKGRQEPPLSG